MIIGGFQTIKAAFSKAAPKLLRGLSLSVHERFINTKNNKFKKM
jgi:hypothetical protein